MREGGRRREGGGESVCVHACVCVREREGVRVTEVRVCVHCKQEGECECV